MPKKAGRASNGMGSIRQRADGRWEARYSAPDGRQHSVYGKTEKEVTAKLRGTLHELDSGSWREPSRLSVAEWLDIWLRDYQAHTNARTQKTYADMVRLHIAPVIGDVKMSALAPIHVRRVVNAMTARGLSANYVHHCHGVMSVAFRAAVEAGLLKSNPASGVRTPRVIKKPFTVVDRDSIPAFIDAARAEVYGSAAVFLLMTGLRVGEMRGLQWQDIDAASMRVARQLSDKGPRAFSLPKDGSVRTIELPPHCVDLLAAQKKQLAEMRLRAGEKWQDDDLTRDLVFRSISGSYISGSAIHRTVRAIGAKIGLPALHPHDLRHSYAVAALRSGVDVKTVQNNLGHRNAAMTLDVYAAYTTDAGKVGAERLAQYWIDALNGAE